MLHKVDGPPMNPGQRRVLKFAAQNYELFVSTTVECAAFNSLVCSKWTFLSRCTFTTDGYRGRRWAPTWKVSVARMNVCFTHHGDLNLPWLEWPGSNIWVSDDVSTRNWFAHTSSFKYAHAYVHAMHVCTSAMALATETNWWECSKYKVDETTRSSNLIASHIAEENFYMWSGLVIWVREKVFAVKSQQFCFRFNSLYC